MRSTYKTEWETLKWSCGWLMEGCGRGELILEQCLRATSYRSLQGEGDCTQRETFTKLCKRSIFLSELKEEMTSGVSGDAHNKLSNTDMPLLPS